MSKDIGPCPICGRPMIEGPSIDEHHWVPRAFKGRETAILHRICHTKIHSIFTERELYLWYHTPERIREHEEMAKFIKWIQKRPPEFYDSNRESRQKKLKRSKK